MKIAVVRNDHLGDLVLTTPLLKVLAKAGHEVTAIAPAAISGILVENPSVAAIKNFEDIAPQFPKDWVALGAFFRKQKFDAILLPYGYPRQLLWASAMSGAKLRIALWSGVWGRLTGHNCLRSRIIEQPRPYAVILLELARALGLSTDISQPEVFVTASERNHARGCLKERLGNVDVICIHPGSGGSACNLDSAQYEQAAVTLLKNTNLGIVVTGTRKEASLVSKWPSEWKESRRIWYAFGELNIREFAAILSQVQMVICPSTGTLHLASALGVRTVSPFCGRPGLCAKVWGAQATSSLAIELPREKCEAHFSRTHTHCDFRGEITGRQLALTALSQLGL
ncbi:MAG: hypothetical protein JWN25_3330 [Verrucomicrobiales bacterium]|nr:hypothetical protein [Verrucomicrobiales bacterium]